ncbi:hypothetical protein GWK91_05390 [Virgibacillus sp. MSP4-1]|nr:hypothetical protein GWK91_05390 [Virgibacillus sp. MSP4-1]
MIHSNKQRILVPEKDIVKYSYFTESINLSDDDLLADIAENSGLNREESLTVIKDDNAYADDVRMDERIAHQYRISGVPFFILNQKYAISGAQPLETFISALDKVWEEENPQPQFEDLSGEGNNDAFCADGSCAVPTDDK